MRRVRRPQETLPLSERLGTLRREPLGVGSEAGTLVYGGRRFLHRLTVDVVEAV